MAIMSKINKQRLGDLLAIGYARLGKVLPRKPFKEDDDDGGEGESDLRMESHPWLTEQPLGAASDLTYLIQDLSDVDDLVAERSDDLTHELKQSYQKSLSKSQEKTYTSAPKPSPP